MEKYLIISPIGEGSFAKVYRGREKFTGRVRILRTRLVPIDDGFVLFRMWR